MILIVITCHHSNMVQYIPYSIVRDLFIRNIFTYNSLCVHAMGCRVKGVVKKAQSVAQSGGRGRVGEYRPPPPSQWGSIDPFASLCLGANRATVIIALWINRLGILCINRESRNPCALTSNKLAAQY